MYNTSRIRSRYKKTMKLDADFCPYYANPELNPDYHAVQVCEHCGCGTTEHPRSIGVITKERSLASAMASQWKYRSYGGKRSWQDALKSYQSVLLTAGIICDSKRVIAGLLHHIAWLYCYQGQHELEQRYMRYALSAYQEVYEWESDDNDARLLFIMAELHRRLGDYIETETYFDRIIKDNPIMDTAMTGAAREQWSIMHKGMKALQMEIPDPLFNEESVKLT